ncbi:SDR family NAD(P)-dependent oxidoreductase [Scytonema sp. UIC 10036]|uniref:SDR family oxidoreductase n=1 Tax=Scytonema sp. UIC 10036 TaxID=2304196 RepID=UPI0012DA9392|nr:SDR family oxidoreductase [Scytonema sp. UIC 10036]MUG98609.1 SDR family NAD(P)-dependent oxidoreductase [Scytonema sp. UIC 10036]
MSFLQNKVAIITGASSGIGAATAKELDAVGMKLVLSARSQDKLDKLAASLNNAAVLAGAITDVDMPQKLVDFALQTFGQLDVVLNNAGGMTVGSIEEIDIEAVCQMVRLNVESVYRMAYVALRHFKKVGSGFLINTSSVSGLKTVPRYGAYNGTKFAVEAFTDALRMELAGTGIKVAAIAPGTVDTGLYDHWNSEDKSYINSGGALQPEDIARCVRFILEQPEHVLIPRLLIVPRDQPV